MAIDDESGTDHAELAHPFFFKHVADAVLRLTSPLSSASSAPRSVLVAELGMRNQSSRLTPRITQFRRVNSSS